MKLPPGRLRLATTPSSDRVGAGHEHIGIAVVAAFAASVAAMLPVSPMTATRRRTRSAANSGSRSLWF